jgi:tetratricopeptide (TPR) repeat protein
MRGYTSQDVAKLLDLSVAQVRAFARSSFLSPDRGPRGEYRFTFHDLVLLRAAKELAAQRIPTARIRRSLQRLRDQLPTGRSLTEVRITAEGDDIVVRDGETTWSPESGQVLLDFEVAELCPDVAPLAQRAAEHARRSDVTMDADAWYLLGVDLEPCAPTEARDAYRQAVRLDPSHADAHVNLGRLLHESGRPEEAAQHYRQALAARPDDCTAAFNLGTALEDLQRDAEAIETYERAIAVDPGCADAHFNLSRLYERLGRRTDALGHLKSYKQLTERTERTS